MAQVREIYDGSYSKRTGNNKDINWKGKVGAMAGCTEIIYEHLESLSAMGDRFAMYSIEQPDRKEALRFSIDLKRKGESKDESRAKIRTATKEYIEYVLKDIEKLELTISPETEDAIIEVADFCTKVRSGVVVDKKYNRVEFVPSKEMPMRLTEQLLALGTAFMVMRKKDPKEAMRGDSEKNFDLTPGDLRILNKVAFDSIPIKRRMALKLLAKYSLGARTAGLATTIGYETRVISGWLSQLNGLGICDREKIAGPQGDRWKLREEYADIMIRFENISVVEGELTDENITVEEAAEEVWTTDDAAIAAFDSMDQKGADKGWEQGKLS
jgi:hypothetical protein